MAHNSNKLHLVRHYTIAFNMRAYFSDEHVRSTGGTECRAAAIG
jgi:hypothetical protein